MLSQWPMTELLTKLRGERTGGGSSEGPRGPRYVLPVVRAEGGLSRTASRQGTGSSQEVHGSETG